ALLDDAIRRSVNILSIIHPHVYFPTYSNSLKDIAGYLGFAWAEPSASGIQSLVWREMWCKTRDDTIKATLIQYNMEDCLALKHLVEFIQHALISRPDVSSTATRPSTVISTNELFERGTERKCIFGKKEFVLEELAYINRCAYFDYQRDRV